MQLNMATSGRRMPYRPYISASRGSAANQQLYVLVTCLSLEDWPRIGAKRESRPAPSKLVAAHATRLDLHLAALSMKLVVLYSNSTPRFIHCSATQLLHRNMASAYGNGSDDEDGVPVVARHQPGGQWANNAQAGSSRHRESSIGSSAAGSRSFLNRLENTLSPGRSRYASSDVDEVPGTEDLDLDGEEDEDEGNDVRRMGRIWVKERGTVDIMQWEGDLIDTLFDKLEQQVSPTV